MRGRPSGPPGAGPTMAGEGPWARCAGQPAGRPLVISGSQGRPPELAGRPRARPAPAQAPAAMRMSPRRQPEQVSGPHGAWEEGDSCVAPSDPRPAPGCALLGCTRAALATAATARPGPCRPTHLGALTTAAPTERVTLGTPGPWRVGCNCGASSCSCWEGGLGWNLVQGQPPRAPCRPVRILISVKWPLSAAEGVSGG